MPGTPFELCRIFESGMEPDFLEELHKEALLLRNEMDTIKDEDFHADPHFGNDGEATYVNWKIESRKTVVDLFDFIPRTIETLDAYGAIYDINEKLKHFPAGFTLNYCPPKAKLALHKDIGNIGIHHTTRVVNIVGSGDFRLFDPIYEELIESTEVHAGQIHEFDNPAELFDRPPHEAITTSNIERISLAFTIPHSVLGIEI